MKFRLYPFRTICIFLEMLLAIVVCFGNFFNMPAVISGAFTLTFFLLVCLMIKETNIRKINKIYVLLVLLSSINVIINALLSPISIINFDYFKKLILFLSAISFFFVIAENKVENYEQKIALRVGFFLALSFPVAYYLLDIRTMLGQFLTMGFTNPNLTALWLLHGFLFVAYVFFRFKNIWIKGILVALEASLLNIVILTSNRAIWVALLSFVVLVMFAVRKKSKGLSPKLITLIILLPIIVVVFYDTFLSSSFFQSTFSFMISEGKGLGSRAPVWNFALEKLKTGWLLGDYSGISYGTGMSQMHNTHLDTLCSYGFVPFILFIYLLREVIIKINEEVTTLAQYIALCAFLAVIIFGIFEAAMFSGSTGLVYLTGGFLLLAKSPIKRGL